MENTTNTTYYNNIVIINRTMQAMVDQLNQIKNQSPMQTRGGASTRAPSTRKVSMGRNGDSQPYPGYRMLNAYTSNTTTNPATIEYNHTRGTTYPANIQAVLDQLYNQTTLFTTNSTYNQVVQCPRVFQQDNLNLPIPRGEGLVVYQKVNILSWLLQQGRNCSFNG